MTQGAMVENVAKALYTEFTHNHFKPRVWDDLEQTEKSYWCHMARVAINAHNESRTQVEVK